MKDCKKWRRRAFVNIFIMYCVSWHTFVCFKCNYSFIPQLYIIIFLPNYFTIKFLIMMVETLISLQTVMKSYDKLNLRYHQIGNYKCARSGDSQKFLDHLKYE